jgi:hypothetical protein
MCEKCDAGSHSHSLSGHFSSFGDGESPEATERAMFRRSLVVMSKQAERTIVRDPRKKRVPAVRAERTSLAEIQPTNQTPRRQLLPFEPNPQNAQAVGSSMVSYMLAGAGMAVGFSIVGAIFGGF